jgi:hypothetical protein
LDGRVQDNNFAETIAGLKSFFPTSYEPKFAVTEFAVLKNKPVKKEKNMELGNSANTQAHAMLLWNQLMQFHADPSVKIVVKHALAGKENGLFYESPMSTELDYVDPSRKDSEVYAYIPPHADAERIFNEATGDDVVDYELTDRVERLVTRTAGTTFVQMLNYSDSEQTVDLSPYISGVYTSYTLPDLNDHYWDAEGNKQTGTLSGDVRLPAHSLTNVIYEDRMKR